MGVYQRATGINIVQRFWSVDPLTGDATLADPTTVTFTILAPNNTEASYVFGSDLNVTNPSIGVFICALTPPLPPGTYRYRCEGTGAVAAANEDFFDVLESGVLSPVNPGVPITGPCSSWITGDDVANAGPAIEGIGEDTFLLDDVAYDASHLLYELSGRQFPGVCTRTVRPCRDGCSCFGFAPSLGLGPWAWSWLGGWGGYTGWGWYNDRGDRCGCGALSTVRLAGYPVREILSVKIGGQVLPLLDANNNPNYRLDNRTTLVRMNDPGPPSQDRFWPTCQDLALDDTQAGTFSVTYTWGADVPSLGRAAASQMARELWKVYNGNPCGLPSKVTKVVRQGITMDRVVAMSDQLRSGSTGLQIVDAFIATVNPIKMMRRPMVWSPDLQGYARKVGQ